MNSSGNAEEAELKRKADSAYAADMQAQQKAAEAQKKKDDSLLAERAKDSTFSMEKFLKEEGEKKYGAFYPVTTGANDTIVIENSKIKATLLARGGMVGQVELIGLKTNKGLPLLLFTADSTRFGLEFFDVQRRRFKTDSLFFKPTVTAQKATATAPASVTFRLPADSTNTSYIEYKYTLNENDYMLGLNISFVGCEKVFSADTKAVDLVWVQKMPVQEKNLKNERISSTVWYRFNDDENIENLSEGESEAKDVTGSLKWVGFKNQYFSSIVIADQKFDDGAALEIKQGAESNPFVVKTAVATLPIPFGKTAAENFGMKFYFGPNDYHLLKSYDLMLEREIYLGWGIFGWLNKYVFMPVFDWLGSFGWNYGIVILLLTIIVKILLFPIAYKSYLSSAKMRVLKPEIDEINEKHKDDDPMKKQQATMALYKKAGVNPAAGCIPLLLQIPILFALLRLFPAMFELRQQGFWWADDLSTYDSVLELGFNVPLGYGDHVSLWALLMTISTLLYTWMNQQTMSPGGPQLPGMKWLIYIMPVMFLFFLNSNAAALSYYYFISNIITFGQMALMRRFVDEKAIRAKIEDNKKKPVKTSGFLQRLEAAQKKRMDEIKQQQGKGKKK